MSKKNLNSQIIFFADKIHVHRWPMDSPVWSKSTKKKVDEDLNNSLDKIQVLIDGIQIKINNFEFEKIQKVGITIPLFKNEATLVFEGNFDGSNAHIHIKTKSKNFLEIFIKLMSWKKQYFPDM